jgi:hypothetical protein
MRKKPKQTISTNEAGETKLSYIMENKVRKGGRRRQVDEPHRLDVTESFWSGYGCRKESEISGSSCHLCDGY